VNTHQKPPPQLLRVFAHFLAWYIGGVGVAPFQYVWINTFFCSGFDPPPVCPRFPSRTTPMSNRKKTWLLFFRKQTAETKTPFFFWWFSTNEPPPRSHCWGLYPTNPKKSWVWVVFYPVLGGFVPHNTPLCSRVNRVFVRPTPPRDLFVPLFLPRPPTKMSVVFFFGVPLVETHQKPTKTKFFFCQGGRLCSPTTRPAQFGGPGILFFFHFLV